MTRALPNRRRRQLVAGLVTLAATGIIAPAQTSAPVRIGLTQVFLDQRSGFLGRFRAYLETALGRPVAFVQRRSYADIVEQLLNGALSAACLCGYPFVRYRSAMQLCAAPVYDGSPTYRSYIITDPTVRDAGRFEDLCYRINIIHLRLPPLSHIIPLADYNREQERRYLVQVLAHHGGQMAQMAGALGVSRKTLWEKTWKLGIKGGDVTRGTVHRVSSWIQCKRSSSPPNYRCDWHGRHDA